VIEHIPWKLVKSWECIACGICCRRYIVSLTPEEYKILFKFWPEKVLMRKGKPYLKRKKDGGCEFLVGNLCSLQILGMKPVACKVWPFKVLLKPDKFDRDFNGLYQREKEGREYFIYINPKCQGINRGEPDNFKKVIDEIIEIWNGLKKKQYYSTSRRETYQSLSHILGNLVHFKLT